MSSSTNIAVGIGGREKMRTSIDHVMTITADLAKAAIAVCKLGVFCTAESQLLSCSSVNRTIVFQNDYWELLTFLESTPANAPLRHSAKLRSGINGICAHSHDLDDTILRARAAGLPMSEPISLGRKIILDGVDRELSFRVSHCLGLPDALLMFYCQHRLEISCGAKNGSRTQTERWA